MRRACYCKTDGGFEIRRVRSILRNGRVRIEKAKDVSKSYDSLLDLLLDVNRKGYCVIGSLDEVKSDNRKRAYKDRCGKNEMDIDEL